MGGTIKDSLDLWFGRGNYDDTTVVGFLQEYPGHVRVDPFEIHALLPAQAPCE